MAAIPNGNADNNIIDYVTIASTGNATDFGDLLGVYGFGAAAAGATLGIFAGGKDVSNNNTNIIQYVTIATTGNALDFGDLAQSKYTNSGCSAGAAASQP